MTRVGWHRTNQAARGIVAVLGCALLVAGCGDSATSGSDQEQIERLAQGFAADAKDADWKGVCDKLSTKAKAQLLVAGALLGGGDCPKVMAAALALSDEKDAIGKIDPDKVAISGLKVTGDRAVAQMTPADDRDATTRFVKEGGTWKIDADPEDDASTTTTSTDDEDETEAVAAPKLQVPERGYSTTDAGTSYGVVIRNPTQEDAVEVSVQVNVLGKDGDVLSTETDSLAGVPAGEEAYVAGDASTEGEKVERLEITVTADHGAPAGTVKLPEVTKPVLKRDEFGGLSVRVQVRNTLEETLSSITDVYVILRGSDRRIVGGLSGYPSTDLPPGGRAAAEVGGLRDIPAAVSAEAFVDGESTS